MRLISRYVAGGGHTIDAECFQWPRAKPRASCEPCATTVDGIFPPIVCCQSDNRHYTPRLDQVGEPAERCLGGHVMQGGDRHHCVERTRLERNVKQIALLPMDRDPKVALTIWLWIGALIALGGAAFAIWPSSEARRRVQVAYEARVGRELDSPAGPSARRA